MPVQVDEMEESRSRLFWRQSISMIGLLGGSIYALHALIDWMTFHDFTAVGIRLAATVCGAAVFSLASLRPAAGFRELIVTAAVVIAYSGFEVIVYHERAYETVYADSLDLFFGGYCMFLPVRTKTAAFAGVAMIGISTVGELLADHGWPSGLTLSIASDCVTVIVFVAARRRLNELWENDFRSRRDLSAALTELRLTQERLVQSERMAAIGRLTAEIAHELNNPLSLVTLNLASLKNRLASLRSPDHNVFANEELLSEQFELVHSGIRQVTHVVRNLRTMGNLVHDTRTTTDLNGVIEASILLISPKLESKALTIQRDYQSIPMVTCNLQAMSSVFLNLLENAIAASPPGGDIQVATCSDLKFLTVSIRDQGAGVPEAILPHIFEPFVTTTAAQGGTGLGLVVSRRVVESHGGRIELMNREKGVEVRVSLPVTVVPSGTAQVFPGANGH